MDNETEVIRQQMEGTRTALSEKLEKLETQLGEKVHQAGSSVAETAATVAKTVDNVKETVEGTVEAVKNTFDIQRQAERHPWALVGGAVFLGFVGARILRGPSRPRYREYYLPPPPPKAEPQPAPKAPSEEKGFLGQLSRESSDLKQLGIGVAMSVLREVVAKAVPAVLGPPVAEVVNSITTRIGGKPMYHSSSESEHSAHECAPHNEGHRETSCSTAGLGERINPFI